VSVKVYPFDPSFRFDVAQFRALVCDPVTVPPHVDVRLTVDPAYFANDDSDESALCATFLDNVDDVRVLDVGPGLRCRTELLRWLRSGMWLRSAWNRTEMALPSY
jgi:hypothetical protein